MNEGNLPLVLQGIGIVLQFLLIPIVSKIWTMDVRIAQIEAVIERRGSVHGGVSERSSG